MTICSIQPLLSFSLAQFIFVNRLLIQTAKFLVLSSRRKHENYSDTMRNALLSCLNCVVHKQSFDVFDWVLICVCADWCFSVGDQLIHVLPKRPFSTRCIVIDVSVCFPQSESHMLRKMLFRARLSRATHI